MKAVVEQSTEHRLKRIVIRPIARRTFDQTDEGVGPLKNTDIDSRCDRRVAGLIERLLSPILVVDEEDDRVAELAAVLCPLYGSGALRTGIKPSLPRPPEVADQAICELLSAVEAAIGIDSGTDR